MLSTPCSFLFYGGCLDIRLLDDIPLGTDTGVFIIFSQSRKAVSQYQCELFGGFWTLQFDNIQFQLDVAVIR